MALLASSVLYSTPKFEIELFKNQPCQLHRCFQLRARHQISPTFSVKTIKAQYGEPCRVNLQLGTVKETLWKAMPNSVKEFPWKKAEAVLLKNLLLFGQKALKWSLLALFISSSLSDVIYSIFRNQELTIPLGLLVGCLITDFLKEVLQEMFHVVEEKELNLPLLGIGWFFVFVKIISAYFAMRAQVFLLHVANGGLMQLLWLWRDRWKENVEGNEDNCTGQDT